MLTPASAAAGGETFTLTVTGNGFAGNSIVYWNSVGLTTTYTSAQELAAEVPASDISKAGSATVYVKNPGTGAYANGVNSNSVSFTIQ
jgi:trimeric autotransporter adhesin